MALSPGTKLASYEILGAVGAGGMGEIFRARDGRLGREVALKLLPDAVAADPERRARFDREARTLASLNHPGIVTIFAVEEAEGHHVIVMELVEGRPLADAIPKGGFPLDRLLSIATQLAGAAAAAHQHGIVHRDLKPANVMVGAHDRVKVLDFGLAKLREDGAPGAETLLPSPELTGEGRIVGTVAYMSPEQAEGRKVDERTDIFSLGVLLYEMATGERPFRGDTSLSVLSAILRETPRPISELNPAVPRDLVRIARRCLAKDPDDRYQSAADLRNDLEDLRQASQSGQLDRPAALVATSRPRSLNLALAAIAVAAVAGLAWMLWSRPSAPAPPTVPQMSFSRLTLLEGVTQEPSISPDGKWVAYVNNAGGNQDIYLQSTTGQTSINLTKDSTANDTSPAFSPDGEFIAFRSERDGGGLFIMGRTGESVRRLTKPGYQPAWFPDGRTLAFVSVPVNAAETRGGDISELWVVDASGGQPRRLTNGDAVQPRVSPNGLRVAFYGLPTDEKRTALAGANRDIWTVATDGSNAVRVTAHEGTDWNPVWSPDGEWLYYLSNRAGSMNLWRVAIDEATGVTRGSPQALSAPASYIRHFSLSADGRLATYATLETVNNVARVPLNQEAATIAGPVQALTTGPRDFGSGDSHPDGQQLVMGTSARVQEDLYVLDTRSGGLRNLTNDLFRDRNPRWSPEGQRVFFYSDRGGGYDVWSIDSDGSGLRQLTHSGGRRYYPVPSPDGQKMAAVDVSAGEIFVYDLRDLSRPPEKLPPVPPELRREGAPVTPVSWSPDGIRLAGQSSGFVTRVYSIATRRFQSIGPTGGWPRWLADGRRVILGRNGRLFVVDTETGESRELLSLNGEILQMPALTLDGRYLYFLRGTQSGDVWVARFDGGQTPATP